MTKLKEMFEKRITEVIERNGYKMSDEITFTGEELITFGEVMLSILESIQIPTFLLPSGMLNYTSVAAGTMEAFTQFAVGEDLGITDEDIIGNEEEAEDKEEKEEEDIFDVLGKLVTKVSEIIKEDEDE